MTVALESLLASGVVGGGTASDITVDPAVAGQTNVQDALAAVATTYGEFPQGYDSAFRLNVPNADAGSYALMFQGQTTADIAYNEDPYTKLVALSTIGGVGGDILDNCDPAPPNTHILVFFVGTLSGQLFTTPDDFSIASQNLTLSGDPVVVTLRGWETGGAPDTGVQIAETRVALGAFGTANLWFNLGTVETPDWQMLRGLVGFDESGAKVVGAAVTISGSGVSLSTLTYGQFQSKLDLMNSALRLVFWNLGGDTIGGFHVGANELGVFSKAATPAAQQTLTRPSGDAGDIWDVLAAYGLVKAP